MRPHRVQPFLKSVRRAAHAGAVTALTTILLVAMPPASHASSRAVASKPSPVDPPYTIALSKLRAAVTCDAAVHPGTKRRAVLLVHGTGGTPGEYWSWNWGRALPAAGFGVCTVALPRRASVSALDSAQYVAYAAQYAAKLSGRKIAIIGHSQGGTLAVWAAKFWPSVARRTSDVISLDGGFRGSPVGSTACLLKLCSPIDWQFAVGSHFMNAVRNAPLPARASVTAIWSKTDELLIGNPDGSVVPGATNIPIQDLCPLHFADHITVLIDSATYALVMDALTHAGPANLARTSVRCSSPFMPHVQWTGLPKVLGTGLGFVTALIASPVTAEPVLPSYAAPYGG